jgi:hypothetical protein
LRIWSLHPACLDRAGLTAVWREGLLAKKVLEGKTRGYKHHPQLSRFKTSSDPVGMINLYLFHIAEEATKRGYKYNKAKIGQTGVGLISVTSGQMDYERAWLRSKIVVRNPKELYRIDRIQSHPIFKVVEGKIEDWEKVNLTEEAA